VVDRDGQVLTRVVALQVDEVTRRKDVDEVRCTHRGVAVALKARAAVADAATTPAPAMRL
jgi:hypothetical protein